MQSTPVTLNNYLGVQPCFSASTKAIGFGMSILLGNSQLRRKVCSITYQKIDLRKLKAEVSVGIITVAQGECHSRYFSHFLSVLYTTFRIFFGSIYHFPPLPASQILFPHGVFPLKYFLQYLHVNPACVSQISSSILIYSSFQIDSINAIPISSENPFTNSSTLFYFSSRERFDLNDDPIFFFFKRRINQSGL